MIIKQIVGAVGIFIGVLGAAFSLIAIGEIVTGTVVEGTYEALVLCSFVGALAGYGGRRLMLSGAGVSKALAAGDSEDPESKVLAIAAQGGGRVTIAEIAAKSSLTIDEATQAVAALSLRGMADAIVTEGGVVVYQIRGLLSAAAKADARDILDA